MRTMRPFLSRVLLDENRFWWPLAFTGVVVMLPAAAMAGIGVLIGMTPLRPTFVHPIVPMIVLVAISGVFTIGWTRRFMRSLEQLRDEPFRCRNCTYDLRGTVYKQCPECGEVLS